MKKFKRVGAVFASLAIIAAAAAAVYFVLNSDNANGKSKLSQQNVSGTILEGNETFKPIEVLKKVKVEGTEKEYVTSFMLDAVTFIKLNGEERYLLCDSLGNRIQQSEFLDDLGNRLSVSEHDGKLTFKTSVGSETKTFLVNGHTLEVLDGSIYIDLLAMRVLKAEPTTATTTVSTTTKKTTASGKRSRFTAMPKTTTIEPTTTTLETDESGNTVTTVKTTVKTTSKTTTKTTKKTKPKTTPKATVKTTAKATTTTTTTTMTTTTTLPAYNPVDSYCTELLRLVNLERTNRGLEPLIASKTLDQAALVRAKEISQSFEHKRLDGRKLKTIMSDYGLSFKLYGENIAAGQQSAIETVSQWMTNESMRSNILNPEFKYFGSSHYYLEDDENYKFDYWTACFYTPIGEVTSTLPENPAAAEENTVTKAKATAKAAVAKPAVKTTVKAAVKPSAKTAAKVTVKTTAKKTTEKRD